MIRVMFPVMIMALSVSLWTSTALASDDVSAQPHSARAHPSPLLRLPRPMRMIRANPERFAITDEQAQRLETELHAVYSPQMHALMDKTVQLEEAMQTALLIDGRDLSELKADLERLIGLKRQLLQLRVAALAQLRTILSPEQFSQLVAAHQEHRAEKRKQCRQQQAQDT